VRVLAIHNAYASDTPSGENLSFAAEVALLRARGHDVGTYVRSNDEIAGLSARERLRLPWRAIHNAAAARDVAAAIRAHRPDVAHVQNTFPLISPAVLGACRSAGVPVVLALRNYRLICPAATCFRDGRVCEDCVGKAVAWPGLVHGCYHGSAAQTAGIAVLLAWHRLAGTWLRDVDVFVTPSAFARDRLAAGGLPGDRIAVKPNFLEEDPGERTAPGMGAVFVGRLAEEKGTDTLLEAWARLGGQATLTVVGDGPDRQRLESRRVPGVTFAGRLDRAGVLAAIKAAAVLIFPSRWYETFGRVTMEAFACGVPVIASQLGALAEAVEDGRTGLLFEPGDAAHLAERAAWLLGHPDEAAGMGRAARAAFLERYTADRNYALLTGLYDRARAAAQAR